MKWRSSREANKQARASKESAAAAVAVVAAASSSELATSSDVLPVVIADDLLKPALLAGNDGPESKLLYRVP